MIEAFDFGNFIVSAFFGCFLNVLINVCLYLDNAGSKCCHGGRYISRFNAPDFTARTTLAFTYD